eukprot:Sspe_Gene.449::Locus_157_Transcript_4_5_Confidence_0.222_Length_570::g.449::m.449
MRALLLVALFAVAANALFGFGKHSYDSRLVWKTCGKHDSDLFQVSQLTVSPYPPKRDQEFKIHLSGNLLKAIEHLNVEVKVHFGFIPLASETVNLCDADKELCPMKQGPLSIDKAVTLPSKAPAGHYRISARGKNSKGEEVICVTLDAKID